MSQQAGWFPDPSGDASRLRYWNGSVWTNDYAPAAGATVPVQQPYQQQSGPIYAQAQPATYAYAQVQTTSGGTDKGLRMAAFILCLLSTIAVCWLIIPLAWMVPMTVISWGIYQGTRPNTVAFGVCTLLFVSIIGGILLLCSTKDR
jgi:hypothetical protein